ncbi:MAG: zinc ribbon domain-containing protein [Thaumarchaeota archaeon]|nr:zinc ribbon domain-containing protein [Nitrososphaerota archaeon]
MGTTVGRPIAVRDVLSKSTNLLTRTPALLIPQVIALVISLLGDFASTATFSVVRIVLVFVGVVVSIIITGAYPSMVQAALAGGQLSVEHSLRQAAKRFWSLLAAGILVGLIVALGSIALLVPGIIFLTWYAYTVPAIMLENKGALAGMSASKMFGRDKKWSTFILGVVVFIVIIVIAIIQAAVGRSSPLAGGVVSSLLSFPVDAWISVIITYAYLTYGPSSVPASSAPGTPEVLVPGVIPSPPMNQQFPQAGGPVTASGPANFCRSCGSPLAPGSKFCANCGQSV